MAKASVNAAPKAEQDFRGRPPIRKRSEGDQYRCDARKADEAALNWIVRFAECLLSGENPLQDEEEQQQRPNHRRQCHQRFADERRRPPHQMSCTPCVVEARQSQNDAEEGGGNDRRLQARDHGFTFVNASLIKTHAASGGS
jgi:hypothetical protein